MVNKGHLCANPEARVAQCRSLSWPSRRSRPSRMAGAVVNFGTVHLQSTVTFCPERHLTSEARSAEIGTAGTSLEVLGTERN